ncbi:glycoside hydrolase family 28 protein [Lactobacillus sp. ESL0731]|uniref:glycoside hydrolase family 28 protein n=1 Tax=unclassified Lactobacillus TaxID=2620435 RepID=UPI0023F9055C|nr:MULTISPECIES: glycoside hydrolase family 28 protein [unclassified Lactobacillus]WEV51087.1 glycoside hydrolase family 28 protein [Lactobacillus sp. ESL0700]WEV62216.1 glycoside hydrolase family 28 protein [Lactobacillus sp. ESL0731]
MKHIFKRIFVNGLIAMGIILSGASFTLRAEAKAAKETVAIKQKHVSKKDTTQQIQSAINHIAKVGGGKVIIAPGTYYLKYLNLKSNVNLHLDRGAKLVFSDKFSAFPAVNTRYEGAAIKMRHPDIYGNNIYNAAITGSGTLDGNGQAWWKMYKKAKQGPLKNAPTTSFKYTRPFLLAFDHSSQIKIQGIKLVNSPAWTIHPLESENVLIQGITIDNPLTSPNTDGIDPESSNNVKILNNTISDGDDCIAIKSGIETTNPKSSSHNIIISNNLMQHGHGGVVFGSEMSGGIHNVIISNNIFDHTDRGIRMKTRRGRGGQISNVTVSNIIMQGVITPLAINEFYGKSGATANNYLSNTKQPITSGTPAISNISLTNITATDVSSVAGFIYGIPESPVDGVTLSNYSVTMAPNAVAQEPEMIDHAQKYADSGFWFENTTNVHLNNVSIKGITTEKFVHNVNNQDLNWKN